MNINKELDILKSIDINEITIKDLERLLPFLGLNNEILNEQPPELRNFQTGIGLRFWQYPNQLSKYLKYISSFKINSYLEIGCRWGGTFVIHSEIFKKNNTNLQLFANDVIDKSDILKSYENYQNFTYLQKSSFDLNLLDFNNTVDFIFIDGDHSHYAVLKDFLFAKKLNPKYIVFHDIASDVCQGVVDVWNVLKNYYRHVEFTDQYKSVNGNFLGIGILHIENN